MKRCAILAPGPSMSAALAHSIVADYVVVVANVFEIVDSANALVAQDRAWWAKYPAALEFNARKFSCNRIPGVERIVGPTDWSSGVLALEVAYQAGYRDIDLYGFDMKGTHFFGPYTNGLTNTPPDRREVHQVQFFAWRASHPDVAAVNHTAGSLLRAYPHEI